MKYQGRTARLICGEINGALQNIDTSPHFLAVDLQRLPGTFEHALNLLLDPDLIGFDTRFRNDETASSAGLINSAVGRAERLSLSFVPQPSLPRLGAGHFVAALRAFAAGLDAVFHAADLLAALGAGVANLGTDRANLLVKGRTAQQEVSRRLADFSAIDHQAKMTSFDVFASYRKAMSHRGMQAGFMAVTTCIYARLHVIVSLSVVRRLGVVH